jgi:HTH-type transcriptional regulator/antitoxin HigA
MTDKHTYRPDTVSPPGETLQDLLDERGLTQVDLADRTGLSVKTINEIIKGKAVISHETALAFERVFGIPANFWNRREQNYREYLLDLQEEKNIAEHIGWLKEIPVDFLIEHKKIKPQVDDIAMIKCLLAFFGVSSVLQWKSYWNKEGISYRRVEQSTNIDGKLATWLRIGEIEAAEIKTPPYDADLFLAVLKNIRESFTKIHVNSWCSFIVEHCQKAGVAVVFFPEIPKTGIYGCARWLSPDKALIQMTARLKTYDQFWFTFFHEATHIYKHKKKLIFVEQSGGTSPEEEDANRTAANILIPKENWDLFVRGRINFDEITIKQAAEQMNVLPAIIVGRLQREGLLEWNKLTNLKGKLTFK